MHQHHHSHDHESGGHPGASGSLEQRNREFFDHFPRDFQSLPWVKELEAYVSAQIRQNMGWVDASYSEVEQSGKGRLRLLDYACGPGAITRALQPYVSEVRGIDISPTMVGRFNEWVSEAGLSPSRFFAIQGNLMSDAPGDTVITGHDFYDFDIAAVGLAFHHMDGHGEILKRIAARLKPGGTLLVVDFFAVAGVEDEPFHKAAHGSISKLNFSEQDLKSIYDEAGLIDFGVKVFPEQVKISYDGGDHYRTVFLSKGRKPDNFTIPL